MISGLKISSKRKQLMGLVPIVGLMLIAVTLVGYSPERIANAERVVAVIRNQPHYTKIEGCGEVNNGVLEINVTATGDGAMAGVKDCVKVITSSPDGYRFYLSLAGDKQEGALIRRTEGGTELVGDASKYQENEKIRGIDGTIGAPKPLTPNTWGFALKTNETGLVDNNFDEAYGEGKNFTPADGSKWAKVPKQGEILVAHETDKRNDTPNSALITPTNPEGKGAELNFYYGVKVDSGIKEGVYAGRIIYTVVAKTSGSVGYLSTITYLQDAKPAMCALSPEGQEYNLIDKRDGKAYRVAKLKDGNCWMTQSLALKLDKENGIEVELSDIKVSSNMLEGGDEFIPPDDPPRPPEEDGPRPPEDDGGPYPEMPEPVPEMPKPKPIPKPGVPEDSGTSSIGPKNREIGVVGDVVLANSGSSLKAYSYTYYPDQNSAKIENKGDAANAEVFNSGSSLIYGKGANSVGYYGAMAALVNKDDIDQYTRYSYRGSICPRNWTLPQVNNLDYPMPDIYRPRYKRYTNRISFDGLTFYNYIDEMKRRKDELKGDYFINELMKRDGTFDLKRLTIGQTEDRMMAVPNGLTKGGNLGFGDEQLRVQGEGEYGVYWQAHLDYDYTNNAGQHYYTLVSDMELFGIGKFSQEELYMDDNIEADAGRRVWKRRNQEASPEDMSANRSGRRIVPTAQVRCLMLRERNALHDLGYAHMDMDS